MTQASTSTSPTSTPEIPPPMPWWKSLLYRIALHLIIYHHGSLIASCFVSQILAAPLRLISVSLYRWVELISFQWGMINFDIASELTRRKWEFHFYGDELTSNDNDKSFLIISNHTCTADWVFNMHYAALNGSSGKLRFFMKRDHLVAPVIGWAAWLHDMIFLKRTDRNYDLKVITDKLQDFVENKSPNWLWLYPEGTFVSPLRTGTVEKTQSEARKRGRPVFDYVLNPKTTAFSLSLEGKNKEAFDSVLDITIAFGPPHKTKLGLTLQPQMVNCLRFEIPTVDLYYHVRRFKIKDVKDFQDKKSTEEWLHKRFEEKEKLLKYFDEHGHFPGESRPAKRPFYYYIVFILTLIGFYFLTKYLYKNYFWVLFSYWLFVIVCMNFVSWYDDLQGLTPPPSKPAPEKKNE